MEVLENVLSTGEFGIGILNLATDKTQIESVKEYKSSKEVFDELYAVNVNEYTEERKGLTYLPWADAMMEVKKRYPDFSYNILWFNGFPFLFHEDLGYMVFTTVTIENETRLMWLPVLDTNNKAMTNHEYTYDTKSTKGIKVAKATWYDINKALMRCIVKNIGVFGLGINIYKKDSLPEPEEKANELAEKQAAELAAAQKAVTDAGNAAIKRGVKKESLYEVLEKDNNGDRSTTSIPSVELCKEIEKKIKALKAEA